MSYKWKGCLDRSFRSRGISARADDGTVLLCIAFVHARRMSASSKSWEGVSIIFFCRV